MTYELYKISLSNEEIKFESTENEYEYKFFFDNCISIINLKNIFSKVNSSVEAESYWPNTNEIFKDNFIVRKEVQTSNFPQDKGYSVFPITWTSSSAMDDGFIVIKSNARP